MPARFPPIPRGDVRSSQRIRERTRAPYPRMSCGTTRYTASGTTTSVSTNARRTGFHSPENGAIANMPRVTSGKIASHVITALTWMEGGAGATALRAVAV